MIKLLKNAKVYAPEKLGKKDILIEGEKILLMQNMQNISASEVISTYVYKTGVASASPNFSYPTAIGLFTSVINLIVILCANRAARRIGDVGFW